MSEKTKATLYLEEDLVNRAKESDLNMSEIANNALKERFGLEKETTRQRNLRTLLQTMKDEDRLHSLPFKIRSIELEDIRKFDELSLEFEDDLNIIHGPNGSGKTTIIETVINTINTELGAIDKDFIKHNRNSGKASVELLDNTITRRFTPGSKYDEGGDSLLLLDTPFGHIDNEHTRDLLSQLKDTIDAQIILTTVNKDLAEYADNSIKLRTFSEARQQELENEIADLEGRLEDKQERLMKVVNEIEDLEAELDDIQASMYEVETLEDDREELQESIDRAEKEIAELEGKIDSVEEELENSDSEREIGRLEERRDNLSEQLTNKENQVEQYHDELEEMEDQLDQTEDLSEEKNQLRSIIEHKRNIKHELEDEIEVLHNELEELKNEKQEIEAKTEVAR